MPCTRPLKGFYARDVNPTGKRSIVWNPREGFVNMKVQLPCGQCAFCRLENARNWAVRCTLESSLYFQNCFLTLTYKPECVPARGFLDYDAAPLFMMRLREKFGAGIRSFGCAEYGEKFGRPHFHLCVLNFNFPDREVFQTTPLGDKLYRSDSLEKLWPFGHASIGDLTFESASYVARYVTKKITGRQAESHYEFVDGVSGEVFSRPPERSVCVARRPGLGKPWFDRYWSDVYPSDELVCRGRVMRPPKYFDRLYEKMDPEGFRLIKIKRMEKGEIAKEKFESLQPPPAVRDEEGFYNKFGVSRELVLEELSELRFKELHRRLEHDE